MDMQRIGCFLGLLRKENGMTQEQLGEQLGVTNKTVSRWETGTYLPPVECLQMLSDLYGITINEILSAERLGEKEYREKAEENIKTVLSKSTFTLVEKIAYFKKKWLRDHRLGLIFEGGLYLALLILAVCREHVLLAALVNILSLWRVMARRNEMMIYIEDRAFDGSGTR